MSEPLQARTLPLESEEAVRFLMHLTHVRHLGPFWGRECSLAEAATRLGIGKSRMAYWVGKLLELGLIVQVRVEKRGRASVPIYRSSAEVFTAPLERVPLEWEGGLLEAHRRDFDRREQTSVLGAVRANPQGWHVRFALEGEESRLDILPVGGDKSAVPFVSEWGRARLKKAQAQVFRQELLALARRFEAEAGEEGEVHLFKLLLIEERLE